MKHTAATKAKLSKLHGGEGNPFYGRKHSAETRAMLAAHLRVVGRNREYAPLPQSVRVPGEKELNYLAGIVDGEGSLRFAKGRPFLAVYNGSVALMQWLTREVGGTYRPADYRGRTVNYAWRLSAALDLLAICRALYPVLVVKREDCAAVIAHLEAKYGT